MRDQKDTAHTTAERNIQEEAKYPFIVDLISDPKTSSTLSKRRKSVTQTS